MPRLWLTVALLVLTTSVGFAVGQAPPAVDQPPADTDFTPDPNKTTPFWTPVGGAPFGETEVRFDSPTAFDDDLTAVAFESTTHGFIGGAREIDCDGKRRRVPVIYQHHETFERGMVWDPVLLGDCSDRGGYVGSIAFTPSGRALAVGGDGRYPKREPAYRPGAQAAGEPFGADDDPAGKARVWLWDEGEHWCELGPDSECGSVPGGMRGLTTVAFHDRTYSGKEFGFAGGLGQVWRWHGNGFAAVPESQVSPATGVSFRVRQIRFFAKQPLPWAVAVTSGCCGPPLDPTVTAGNASADNAARILTFGERNASTAPGSLTWAVSGLGAGVDRPDSLYSVTATAGTGDFRKLFVDAVSAVAAPGGAGDERSSVITPPYCAESDGAYASADAELAHLNLSSSRLVAGDGDMLNSFGERANVPSSPESAARELEEAQVWGGPGDARTCKNDALIPTKESPDGVPDWVVGELRSTDTGAGGRGLVVGTALRPMIRGETVDPDVNPSKLANWEPTSEERLRAYLQAPYFKVDSYALNAVDVIDPSGTGWAVGEHGALVRYGELPLPARSGGDDAELGAPRRGELAGHEPYGAFEALTSGDGRLGVPPLAARPLEKLREPALAATGSPNPGHTGLPETVEQIVMSRDADEGWAVGSKSTITSSYSQMALYHYRAGRWERCDPDGVAGEVPPDPACAALADLRNTEDGAPVRILAAARIPLERDGDPGNDDEFEVLAIGTPAAGETTVRVLRYREGRWSDEPAHPLRGLLANPLSETRLSIVFTSPDDGWILDQSPSGTTGSSSRLLHLHGGQWINCGDGVALPPADCHDPSNRTVFSEAQSNAHTDIVTGMVAAGDRVFIYGARRLSGTNYPMIITRRGGGEWTGDPSEGGFDPLVSIGNDRAATAASAMRGIIESLAVADQGGALSGWAVGRFDSRQVGTSASVVRTESFAAVEVPPTTSLLRIHDDSGWRAFSDEGPVRDYVTPAVNDFNPSSKRPMSNRQSTTSRLQLTLPGPEGLAVIAQARTGRIFIFEPEHERWRLLPPGRPAHHGASFPASNDDPAYGAANPDGALDGPVDAVASDGQGGFWAAIRGRASEYDFFRYSDHRHRPVFAEAPNPLADPVNGSFTSIAGSPKGELWGGTREGVLYHYDRTLGWDSMRVAGWDPGRVVTVASPIYAVAVGPDGTGIAVGKKGRIANLEGVGATLDVAAGRAAADDLRSAAVGPDGSAMAGGVRVALVWRSGPREPFRRINRPATSPSATVTGISMPRTDQAYLVTDGGLIYRGTLDGEDWSWQLENRSTPVAQLIPIRAISVDADGQGYAVGDTGLVMRREAGSWTRIRAGFLDDLTSVTGSDATGVLIGGRNGLILTLAEGGFEVARPKARSAQYGEYEGPVVALAASAGPKPGQVEAWAVTEGTVLGSDDNRGLSRLWHYSSDPAEPLIDGGIDRVAAVPDSEPADAGGLTFAAFGKTECHRRGGFCLDMDGSEQDYQVVARRTADEIRAAGRRAGGPAFALFTGDAVDSAAAPAYSAAERTADVNAQTGLVPTTYFKGPRKQRRWRELIADRLEDSGVPLFAAVGGRDLSDARACYGSTDDCVESGGVATLGDNFGWRSSLAGLHAPLGAGEPARASGLEFAPVPFSDDAQHGQDVDVDPPEGQARGASVKTGGAHTHYAFDVRRDGRAIARVVVVDSSFGSLTGSDGAQNPVQPRGGQLLWLEEMVCRAPAKTADERPCTREESQKAIVVSTAPTYSYGPGTQGTATDANAVETTLLRHGVDVVVSGKLGWNGLYYTLAPGLHWPCPGGQYPSGEPSGAAPNCGAEANEDALPEDVRNLRDALANGAPVEVPSADAGLTGALPNVVASSAGGKFGLDGSGTAGADPGFWHGYTVVRLQPSGKVVVEQRPVFDWITIKGNTHALRAGQRTKLRGYGREPVGTSSAIHDRPRVVTQLDPIGSQAITHRYDLFEADPEKPYVPRRDDSGAYVALDPSVATIDRDSGQITAQRSFPKLTYAIAVLSVGRHAASYPIAFQPRRSYTPRIPKVITAAAIPPIRVLGLSAASIAAPPQAPPPASPPPPIGANLALPAPPALPTFPTASAPPIAPPAPPAPPPPPASQSTPPLNLSIDLSGIVVPPTPGVTAQPTPPVNPAPPGGARKEARQKQAATAKSEEGAAEAEKQGVDLAQAPPGPNQTAYTRQDNAFTRRRAETQPSAWTTGLQWGGGMTLMALALALGWTGVRLTPRGKRRDDIRPAPVWNRRD